MVLMLMLELKSYNYIETPFSIVCRKGNESIVKYLIKMVQMLVSSHKIMVILRVFHVKKEMKQ